MILSPDLKAIIATAESAAERFVAHLLQQVDGGPDAVAFHSVTLRSHRYKQQAEADFVVLWKGVVVIFEVKGGGVRKVDGKWWTIDRRNEWKALKEPPMDQANGAKLALRDILHDEGLGWYTDQHAVITPDVEDIGRAIGWLPSNWLARSDMTVERLTGALDRIAANSAAPNHGRPADISSVREKLYGEFAVLPRIDAMRGAVLEEQSRATAGQARFLEGLVRAPRILVVGGAGTGKSLALAEGARQEADQGRSVLITFKSPGLGELFKILVADRQIDVIPFDELIFDGVYDTIFIDEAQDLMTAQDMDKLDIFLAGGRANGRWRMFLDPNNQAHVDGAFDEEVFEFILEEAVEFVLSLNVRNTESIVHVVQEYLQADIGDPGIVHGERLHWHETGGPAGVSAAEKVAEQLVSDGVRPSSIWIIDATSTAGPVTTGEGFIVTSPKYSKGLEADRVIVCNLPKIFDHAGSAAFYVAVTRARVAVHIVQSASDRKRLQDLLQQNMGAK